MFRNLESNWGAELDAASRTTQSESNTKLGYSVAVLVVCGVSLVISALAARAGGTKLVSPFSMFV